MGNMIVDFQKAGGHLKRILCWFIITDTSRRWYSFIFRGMLFGLIPGFIILLFSFQVREGLLLVHTPEIPTFASVVANDDVQKEMQKEKQKSARLKSRLDRLTPKGPYLIIDTSNNKFFLKKGHRVLHQGFCSTGSYSILRSADGQEKWIFKTPRGHFRVRDKIKDPVWRMPDWAFVEEGLSIPAAFSAERYATGVLGDYALDLGDGYLIHGTLYQRFLGLPVTHGCIRLGDKDLKIVFDSMSEYSRVYLF